MSYVSNATIRKGSTVKSVFDENKYEQSIKISNDLIESVDVERLEPNVDYAHITRGFKNYEEFCDSFLRSKQV